MWCKDDFSGLWRPFTVPVDQTIANIDWLCARFAGCLLTWESKMQTETALSTYRVDYIE